MPTKKKRVGFIPREDVKRIIEKLSIENNLSNSKIISILVEEALSIRGIFNKKNGKVTKSFGLTNDFSKNSFDISSEFIDTSNDTKLGNHLNSGKSNHLNEANQEAFNLQTYKKFLSFLKFQEMMEKYDT